MRCIKLGKSGPQVPVVAVGCMRLNGVGAKAAEVFVKTALELGANFFDHADCYGNGECEEMFAKAAGMGPAAREKMILQSKCGIVPGKMFDFSKEHIIESTEGILKRLKTDYLDVLLLHRPDALAEPEDVAEAFDKLHESGKVKYFGVSNQDPYMIQLLQKYVKQPIVANQIQFSVTNATAISQTMNMNMTDDMAIDRDNGVLNFCRMNDITIQPWSPLQYGFFEGPFIGDPKFKKLNRKLDEIAEKYSVTPTAIAFAWILRHPSKMQPVTGTTKPSRLAECVSASDVFLSREEWYEIFLSAGHRLP